MKFPALSVLALAVALTVASAQTQLTDVIITIDGSDVPLDSSAQTAYGIDSNQDAGSRPLLVSADGRDVTLEGNIHRAIPFPSPLSVTASTTLDFDFVLDDLEEVHSICLEENLNLSSDRCFVAAGTQNWGIRLDPAALPGEPQHFSVEVGQQFWGSEKFKYLVFMQDNDSSDRNTGRTTFMNLDIEHGNELYLTQVALDGTETQTKLDTARQFSTSSSQDTWSHPLTVSPDGSAVRLRGNMHRSVPFETPVTITPNTDIEFDFTLVDRRDVHALCFGLSSSTCIVAANTQDWGEHHLDPKPEPGETLHYTLPIGLLYTGTYDELQFNHDNDSSCRSCGDATWSHIRLVEVERPELELTVNGEVALVDSATQKAARTEQDTSMHFLDVDGASVTLRGNVHKALELPPGILIDKATELDFDFVLGEMAEVASLCIVTDDDVTTYTDGNRCFTPAGTQSISWDVHKAAYGPHYTDPATAPINEVIHYHIPVGLHVPEGEAKYLVFMQDEDHGDRKGGVATFSNIGLSQRPSLNVDLDGVATPLFNYQRSYDNGQDTTDNLIRVSEDGTAVSMYGNLWKAFDLGSPLTITDDTVLSFTLEAEQLLEITAICLDEDRDAENIPRSCLKLAGTQTDGLGQIIYRGVKQTYEGETNSYLMKLGEFFKGPVNYLVLVHDNDSSDRTTGVSHIRDIRIYEMKESCLKNTPFSFTTGECTVDNFVVAFETEMAKISGCGGADTWEELLSFFDVNNDLAVRDAIQDVCTSAYDNIPFSTLMRQEDAFLEEFFDGGNHWNYEVDEAPDGPSLATDAAAVVTGGAKYAGDNPRGVDFPDVHNFHGCDLRSAMCCYVSNRKADPPTANAKACYHSFANSRQSSHVRDGYSIYPTFDAPLTCHGFAWGNDAGYADAAFRGNTLFNVAFQHGLYGEGDVEELPGAPMCGCIEQMPVVTGATCTETTVDQSVSVSYDPVTRFTAQATINSINHSDCGDLSGHYGSLVNDGKASAEEKAMLDEHLVGDCRPALEGFLAKNGFEFA